MKTVDFNIKFREKIEKGNYKVTWNNLPVRIICWDRKGISMPDGRPLNILILVDLGNMEKFFQVTDDGTVYDGGIRQDFKLQVTHEDLPSKLLRVKYCLARHSVLLDNIMEEEGFELDDNESAYTNEVKFINSGVIEKNLNRFHNKLKEAGDWDYDDDEDWNLNFKPGDYVVCTNDEGPWGFKVGETYIIHDIVGSLNVVYIKRNPTECGSWTVHYDIFIDMFRHDNKFNFMKMKPFTPVLARSGDNQTWFPHFFESYHPQNHGGEFYMIDCQHTYSQCVPFDGNEDLLRTQNPIPPYYDIRR